MLAVLTGAALLVGAAEAPSFAATPKDKKPAAAKAKQARKTVKFMPGSQETARERATRLQRECKGRVDAGACTGYTQ
jgi:hypothetical protein